MRGTIDEKKLYAVIKQAVGDALREYIKKTKLALVPFVDDEEMKELRKIFGAPARFKNHRFGRKTG